MHTSKERKATVLLEEFFSFGNLHPELTCAPKVIFQGTEVKGGVPGSLRSRFPVCGERHAVLPRCGGSAFQQPESSSEPERSGRWFILLSALGTGEPHAAIVRGPEPRVAKLQPSDKPSQGRADASSRGSLFLAAILKTRWGGAEVQYWTAGWSAVIFDAHKYQYK